MNVLFIIILAFLALMVFAGYRKGFVKMFVGMMALVIAIVGASLLSPVLKTFLENTTHMQANIQEKVESFLDEELNKESHEVKEVTEIREKINKMDLPIDVRAIMSEAIDKDVPNAKQAITKASAAMASAVLTGISFVICFIVMIILTSVLCHVLSIVSLIPLVRQMNGLLGAVLGFVEGLFCVWIFFTVMTVCVQAGWAQACLRMVNENGILSMLYGFDPIFLLFK